MIKKLMMVFCLMFAFVQAQDIDPDYSYKYDNNIDQVIDLAFQEFIYDMGICLAGQDTIVDNVTGIDALVNVYHQIDQAGQILDLFMMIDDELVAADVSSVEDLIAYEMVMHNDLAQACIAWLAAYQNVFTVFLKIHGSDASFIDWCNDVVFLSEIEDGKNLKDAGYQALWQASVDVLQAQAVFEVALQQLD